MTNGEILNEVQSCAKSFARMAERVLHNQDSVFGGAVVIVPPKNAGEQIELLMLDSAGDPAQFWSTIQTRIAIVMDKLKDQERNVNAFGGRR